MANPNLDKPHEMTFGTMTVREAVARGVHYSPIEITQMSHDPEDMPAAHTRSLLFPTRNT
jgi:hypothetical protein